MERAHPLREFRKSIGISLDRLAELTEASKSKLSRIENGHQDADMDFIRRVQLIPGCTLSADDFLNAREVAE